MASGWASALRVVIPATRFQCLRDQEFPLLIGIAPIVKAWI